MTLSIFILKSLAENVRSTMMLTDEDQISRDLGEPIVIFQVLGESIGYVSVKELRKWIDSEIPSEKIQFLNKNKKEQRFVVEYYPRDYMIDQGQDGIMVRYSAWRMERPRVKGYGLTPTDAIYDLTFNVQPLYED